MNGTIGSKVHVLCRAEEETGQTPEPKKFLQPMAVRSVTDLLQLRIVATFTNVQVTKFYIVFHHAAKYFNCLFLDRFLTDMIVVNHTIIFRAIKFLM